MRQTIRPRTERKCRYGYTYRSTPTPKCLYVHPKENPRVHRYSVSHFSSEQRAARAQRHRSANHHSTLSCPFPVLHRCVAPQQKRVPRVRLSTRSTRSDVAGPASDLGDDDDDEDLDDDDDDDDVHLGLGSDLSLDDL